MHEHGEQRVLEDEQAEGRRLDRVLELVGAAAEAEIDERRHAGDAEEQRGVVEALAAEDIGNEARAQALERHRERPDRHAAEKRQGQPLEDEHAGKRDDEGRDLEIGDPIALRGADQAAHDQAGDGGRDGIDPPPHHHHGREPADEADDRADRQVDMPGHDDQQHAERHDDDVAVLQHQVGEVERPQQRAVGHDLEEQHDDQERQQHAVVAEMGLDEFHPRRLLLGNVKLVSGSRVHLSVSRP